MIACCPPRHAGPCRLRYSFGEPTTGGDRLALSRVIPGMNAIAFTRRCALLRASKDEKRPWPLQSEIIWRARIGRTLFSRRSSGDGWAGQRIQLRLEGRAIGTYAQRRTHPQPTGVATPCGENGLQGRRE